MTFVIGRLNDLWRFRLNDSTWTWITGSNASGNARGIYGEKGIASTDNQPGAREDALTLYDSCRNTFMLFGGYGYDEINEGAYFFLKHPSIFTFNVNFSE